jgi:hypothetical protein
MASAPEVVPSDAPETVATESPLEAKMLGGSTHDPDQPSRRTRDKICGLSPLVFWIIILVMVIIIASAIGGGVGGGLASQHSK